MPVGESCAISTSGRESDRTGNTAKKEEISVSRGVADVGTKMVEERERETHIYESCPVAAVPRRFCRLIEIPPTAV